MEKYPWWKQEHCFFWNPALFQWLLESKYLNASSRILGSENFRERRPKFWSTHAQQGLCFITDAPEGEGTDVAVKRSRPLLWDSVPHSWGSVLMNLGAVQHYGWCGGSVVISVSLCPDCMCSSVQRGNHRYQMEENNTQEPNIFKWLNYFFLEKAEKVNG